MRWVRVLLWLCLDVPQKPLIVTGATFQRWLHLECVAECRYSARVKSVITASVHQLAWQSPAQWPGYNRRDRRRLVWALVCWATLC